MSELPSDALDYGRLEDWDYLEQYLAQWGPLDGAHLMRRAWDAFDDIGIQFGPQPSFGELAYALGWAHARDWLPQPKMDERIERQGCEDNPVTMRWEYGRCEALEKFCKTNDEWRVLWRLCRIRRGEALSPQ